MAKSGGLGSTPFLLDPMGHFPKLSFYFVVLASGCFCFVCFGFDLLLPCHLHYNESLAKCGDLGRQDPMGQIAWASQVSFWLYFGLCAEVFF